MVQGLYVKIIISLVPSIIRVILYMYTYMLYFVINSDHRISPTSMQNKSQSFSVTLNIGNHNPHCNS